MVEFFVQNETKFPGWRLVVAGFSGERDRAYFEHICAVAASHRVDILSNLFIYDLKELYQKASIFWHAMGLTVDEAKTPLDVEHFGITTVEAMAAGAVPVVIDKGGQREIVDDGINGFRWKNLGRVGNVDAKTGHGF